ncbi:transporter substrate-binding domain-containing protein [Sinomonas sp. JGH33]|uniref:Transporter substrate-binding domain-containing protein n=1 Tax=Sinomonas terricola TaxID=3110330 RepID=A0ABU5TCA4_9MICC|nr:transporter substrate-binding domain-containing protein [Sinomonas sp. JGH33]MEA5457322.1 transporter substrate-binding domain-containing protein [Sinomonas sp. JGH33]
MQTGSVQADDVASLTAECTANGKKPIDVVTLDKQTDINTRLVSGTIDAMASGSDVVGYALQQTGGAIEKAGATYGAAPVGIAVAKDDTALADLVQKAMASLMADGTYTKILTAWNVTEIAVTKSEVNPAAKP